MERISAEARNLLAENEELFSKVQKRNEEVEKEHKSYTERLEKAKNNLQSIQNKFADTETEYKKIDDEIETLNATEIEVQREIAKLKHDNWMPAKIMSKHDYEIFEFIKARIDLFKKTSGMRFDVMALDETISGYINDKEEHLKTFNFPVRQNNIADLLWGEIKKTLEKKKKDSDSEDNRSD